MFVIHAKYPEEEEEANAGTDEEENYKTYHPTMDTWTSNSQCVGHAALPANFFSHSSLVVVTVCLVSSL